MKETLTPENVIRLAQLRVTIAKLTAEEEILANDLKDRMIELEVEVFAPSSIPLRLEKNEYDKSKDGFWETMAKRAFKKIYGARYKTELEHQKDRWPKREVVSLHVKAGNENYQAAKLEKVG